MGKKKAQRVEEIAVLDAPMEPRPDIEPWSTSLGGGRWSLHQASVPILLDDGTEEGSPSKVRGTLDTTGAPELAAAFVERLDAHAIRPALAAYMRGPYRNDAQLARFLPLSPVEAMALLRRRDSELAYIAAQCRPAGHMTEQEIGDECDPPVSRWTITRRRDLAMTILHRWICGSSYYPRVSHTMPMPDPLAV